MSLSKNNELGEVAAFYEVAGKLIDRVAHTAHSYIAIYVCAKSGSEIQILYAAIEENIQ